MRLSLGEVKSCVVSEDQKEVLLTLKNKYIGDRDYAIPIDCLDDWIAALTGVKSALEASGDVDADQVRFVKPRNCTIGADLQTHHLVLLILDHKLPTQKGYAVTPEAAQQMAAELGKNAEVVLANRNARQQPAAGEVPANAM